MLNLDKKFVFSSSYAAVTAKNLLDFAFSKPVNVFVKDKDSKMVGCNMHNLQMLGVTLKDVYGETLHKLVLPDDNIVIEENDKTIIRTNSAKIFAESKHIIRKQNQKIELLCVKMPLYDSSNWCCGVIGLGFYLDMTSLFEIIGLMNKLDICFSAQVLFSPYNEKICEKFSLRERQVIICLLQGKTVMEISKILNISNRTVDTFVDNIKNKLGCNSKSQIREKFYDSNFSRLFNDT